MNTFWQYLVGTVVRPRRTMECLLADPNCAGQGARAVLLIGGLYTLTVAAFAAVGAKISTPAWLAIPPERYYFWEIFYALPVMLAAWLLGSGFVQVVGRQLGGRGSFEGTLACLGFALSLPTFVTWLPETAGALAFLAGVTTQAEYLAASARPGFWQVFGVAYQAVARACFLALFPMAVRAAQRLSWPKALGLGWLTFVVVGLMLVVFIR